MSESGSFRTWTLIYPMECGSPFIKHVPHSNIRQGSSGRPQLVFPWTYFQIRYVSAKTKKVLPLQSLSQFSYSNISSQCIKVIPSEIFHGQTRQQSTLCPTTNSSGSTPCCHDAKRKSSSLGGSPISRSWLLLQNSTAWYFGRAVCPLVPRLMALPSLRFGIDYPYQAQPFTTISTSNQIIICRCTS